MIELALVLAMIGALLVLAIPSFSQFFANNEVSTQTNRFASILTRARSEAITRANNVVVCAGNFSAGCTGTWNDGWIMFEDLPDPVTNQTNDNLDDLLASANDMCADAEECILEIDIDGVELTDDNGLTFITFTSSGELAGSVQTFIDANLDDDATDANEFDAEFCVTDQRAITVSFVGRVSVTNATCPS